MRRRNRDAVGSTLARGMLLEQTLEEILKEPRRGVACYSKE
jgi:hypothetical protein